MKRIFFVATILVSFLSCQKDETADQEIPDWLLPHLENLEKSGKCFDCSVTQIEYDNEKYYHLYCGIWSCMYCTLYDSEGNLVNWDQNKFNDFLKKQKNKTIIWQCNKITN